MFFEVIRCLKERIWAKKTLPSTLFMENVRNLLSSNQGRDFAEVLFQMESVGYDVEWSVIDSASVVPQHRERVYVIGHLAERSPRQVFPIENEDKGISPKSVRQVGNFVITKSFGGNPQRGRVYDKKAISPTLNTMQGGGLQPHILVKTDEFPDKKYEIYLDKAKK